jgi:hypothetical protein
VLNRHVDDTTGSVLAQLNAHFHLRTSLPDGVFPRSGVGDRLVKAIEEQAVARGELRSGQLTPRMRRLPLDLARQEMMNRLGPLSGEAVDGITDIFLRIVASTAGESP